MTADLQRTFDAAVPEYMEWLRASREWSWARDEEATTFLLLEHLRLWLFERAGDDERRRAWDAVETLLPSDDELLLNALAVGLLEGDWPRKHRRLMGQRTRELWEEEPA
jgi:hypothetical protein